MAEPHWTGYVGMATGIFGAITGIAGTIMGYVSYRRSNKLKSLDLRLELRKAVNNVQYSGLSLLKELIDHAYNSRYALASATGRSKSGMLEKWKQTVEVDKNTLKKLVQYAPPADMNYGDLTPKMLESKLVEVHQLQVQVDDLRKKYDAAALADEEGRKQLREDNRARFMSKQKKS